MLIERGSKIEDLEDISLVSIASTKIMIGVVVLHPLLTSAARP